MYKMSGRCRAKYNIDGSWASSTESNLVLSRMAPFRMERRHVNRRLTNWTCDSSPEGNAIGGVAGPAYYPVDVLFVGRGPGPCCRRRPSPGARGLDSVRGVCHFLGPGFSLARFHSRKSRASGCLQAAGVFLVAA